LSNIIGWRHALNHNTEDYKSIPMREEKS
jgi:hypothetical protein